MLSISKGSGWDNLSTDEKAASGLSGNVAVGGAGEKEVTTIAASNRSRTESKSGGGYRA